MHSAWCEGENLHLIFTDNTELIVTWGDVPELKGRRTLSDLPATPVLQGPISSQLAGKKVEYCYIDGEDLYIRCTDDHECVIAWNDGPKIKSMNVKLMLEPVSIFGVAGL